MALHKMKMFWIKINAHVEPFFWGYLIVRCVTGNYAPRPYTHTFEWFRTHICVHLYRKWFSNVTFYLAVEHEQQFLVGSDIFNAFFKIQNL